MITIERGLVWAILVAVLYGGMYVGALSENVSQNAKEIDRLRPTDGRLVSLETKIELLTNAVGLLTQQLRENGHKRGSIHR